MSLRRGRRAGREFVVETIAHIRMPFAVYQLDPGAGMAWGRAMAKLARTAAALVSLALLLFPARSTDRKKGLFPFGRGGGLESGLLNAPRLSCILLGFAGRLNCGLGSLRGRSLCGFACDRLASEPLSFRHPDVAGGDDLRSRLYSLQPSGVIRNCPGTFDLSLLRSAGST